MPVYGGGRPTFHLRSSIPQSINPVGVLTPTGLMTGYRTYTDTTVAGGAQSLDVLQAAYDAMPNGTSVTAHRRLFLPASAVYTGSATNPGLKLNSATRLAAFGQAAHITIEGNGTPAVSGGGNTNGARIKGIGNASDPAQSIVFSGYGGTYSCTDMAFRGLAIEGTSTTYATTAAHVMGGEFNLAFAFYGGKNIHITDCVMEKNYGDGAYFDRSNSGARNVTDTVLVQNCLIRNNGRMGWAATAANNVMIVDNTFTDICFAPWDIEPDVAGQVVSNVTIDRNTVTGHWSWSSDNGDDWLLGVVGVAGTISGYLRVRNNIISANGFPVDGVGRIFRMNAGAIDRSGCTFTITGNQYTGASKVTSPVQISNYTLGGTISNNTGWLSSGAFVSDQGGNGTITQSGNT